MGILQNDCTPGKVKTQAIFGLAMWRMLSLKWFYPVSSCFHICSWHSSLYTYNIAPILSCKNLRTPGLSNSQTAEWRGPTMIAQQGTKSGKCMPFWICYFGPQFLAFFCFHICSWSTSMLSHLGQLKHANAMTFNKKPEKGWNESQRLLFDSRGGAWKLPPHPYGMAQNMKRPNINNCYRVIFSNH